MTESISWVAVDWGTSNLRAWGMSDKGVVLASAASDKGMGKLSPQEFPAALGDVMAQFSLPAGHRIDVVVCGMAGATSR